MTDFDKEKIRAWADKNKLYLIGIPVLAVLMTVNIMDSYETDEEPEKAMAYEAELPEKEAKKKSKLELYRERQMRKKNRDNDIEGKESALESFYDVNGGAEDAENTDPGEEQATEESGSGQAMGKQESKSELNRAFDYRNKYQESESREKAAEERAPAPAKRKQNTAQPKPAPRTEEKEEPQIRSRYYLPADNAGAPAAQQAQKTEAQEHGTFYPAILEEDTKLTEGKEFVCLLDRDCEINGKEFKAMSIMYCTATFIRGRVYINMHTLQDTKDKLHFFTLEGYNSNFSKGFPYGSKSEEAVKDNKEDAVDEALEDVRFSGTAKAIKKTIENLEKSTDVLYLKKKTKIYFKREE